MFLIQSLSVVKNRASARKEGRKSLVFFLNVFQWFNTDILMCFFSVCFFVSLFFCFFVMEVVFVNEINQFFFSQSGNEFFYF